MWFTSTPFMYNRIRTNRVKIGELYLGDDMPVRVQSMANTSTHKIDDSVNQAIEIINAGGEMVRFTVIDSKDAEALKHIKSQLLSKGYNTPIVADVHFNPALADVSAKYVDKVRINPGNYLDKRATFTQIEFSDEEYAQELDNLKIRFEKFLNICKENDTAIRIGTNHGSLSDRIMSRYGDSPEGMVEATMEFLRICNHNKFNNVVVSLKSSNTRVMVYAYRLLALNMQKENMHFALHLGVTEAGSGEDGRIKSAVGIGALMHDGLGDTIRVSLTEHPAKEIPVGKMLIEHIDNLKNHKKINHISPCFNPYGFKSRITHPELKKSVVIADLSFEDELTEQSITQLNFIKSDNNYKRTDLSPDILFVNKLPKQQKFTDAQIVIKYKFWNKNKDAYPLFTIEEYLDADDKSNKQNWVLISNNQLSDKIIDIIKYDNTLVLVCFSNHTNRVQDIRALINTLIHSNITNPIIIKQTYNEDSIDNFRLKSAVDTGLFFIDGLANGLWLTNKNKTDINIATNTAFGILQASRTRTTKTEYISCPGCGRTLFDIENSLSEIKRHTNHLKGLKIAVMGCIVNGPGEMADADYGYVGAGPGKVSLYKGKNVVLKNINTQDAVKELLLFIEKDKSNE
jgi:(E)-4-hydroxy-3-methylbut-2-enyl-diphosphate synthase